MDVEVAVTAGLPGFSIVGMADAAIHEARERVRTAIRASGFAMPSEKIVVNLAPSSLKKSGAGFDLPIALAVLVATKQLPGKIVEGRLFAAELSLEGAVRPVTGSLAYALCARDAGLSFVGSAYCEDFLNVDGVDQLTASHLADFRKGELPKARVVEKAGAAKPLDFADIAGHEVAKRALQVAAAGGHGVLMMGPPGSGKTMLASRMPSILPPLEKDEALQVALIHSIAGEDITGIRSGLRPFRSPHHSASVAGLVGGGNPVRPGEITLSHGGVLFLDELPEFKPSVLQSIRQPMEGGNVSITRADGSVAFPARFALITAANPCPCGYYGDSAHECTCTVPQIYAYQNRIGGPLMDRIDVHLDVQRVPPSEVMEAGNGVSSATLREGVMRAREFSSWRHSRDGAMAESHQPSHAVFSLGESSTVSDSAFTSKNKIQSFDLDDAARQFMEKASLAYGMSGRGIVRTLSVARTIADMEESSQVLKRHVGEALGFRMRGGGCS